MGPPVEEIVEAAMCAILAELWRFGLSEYTREE